MQKWSKKNSKKALFFSGTDAVISGVPVIHQRVNAPDAPENKDNEKKQDCVVEESVTFTFGHCRHHAMKGSDRKPEK